MNDFQSALIIYFLVLIAVILVLIFITRLIFAIPTFLRYQRGQIRLLEEIAKKQGVEEKTVKNIISESIEWESASQSPII
ncbi:MAG: hypothetical protein ABI367_11435 [Mucilaginibacter sp.]